MTSTLSITIEDNNMAMLDPPHPGSLVREDCLNALGLSLNEAAEALGISPQALDNLINEQAGISAEMAIRLEKAFGSSADAWLRMQAAYDLAQARQHADAITVKRVA